MDTGNVDANVDANSDAPGNAKNKAVSNTEKVCRSIKDNSALTAPYILMNVLATIVASYGLFENSAAVVIGAMVIATLLGPITGIALALVSGDSTLLVTSILAETCGAAGVLTVALCIGLIHRELPLTNQILSRTSPNIMDLMIALGGGAAGAYATISPRLSVGLVGVAIATALVPPLACCSICLARGELKYALGAFLLFVANMVGIQFASSVVMLLHGYHKTGRVPQNRRSFAVRNGVSFCLLTALTIALGYAFTQSVRKEAFEANTRIALRKALHAFPGVYLADLRFESAAGKEVVTAVLRTPYSFSPERVALLESKLAAPTGSALSLHIRSVITKESTKEGYVQQMPPIERSDDSDNVSQ